MPIPIQLGSLTTRLRNFLRIRGRVRLQLDETVVPTVQVQDLTVGPYQAGVTPASMTQNAVGRAGRQFVVFLNPDATMPPDADLSEDLRFIGRSFSITQLSIYNRTVNGDRVRIGLVPRANITVPVIAAAKQFIRVQNGSGLQRVPVVIGSIVAIPFTIFPATQEVFRGELPPTVAGAPIKVPLNDPPITLESTDVVVIELILGVGGGTWEVNVSGVYQEQAQ